MSPWQLEEGRGGAARPGPGIPSGIPTEGQAASQAGEDPPGPRSRGSTEEGPSARRRKNGSHEPAV